MEGPKDPRSSYLVQLVEAYFCLFPRCLAGTQQTHLLEQALLQTAERLVKIPLPVIQEEYERLNRHSNSALKQLIFALSRPDLPRSQPNFLPGFTDAECLLAIFIQCLRQELGAAVLLSDRFRLEYRELLRSTCLSAPDPETCQHNLIGWLWEAMKSFDPLKAFSANGHGRPTFEAWVRTVVNNKLADEKRKWLKREADELLFYDPRALQVFQERYQALAPTIQPKLI